MFGNGFKSKHVEVGGGFPVWREVRSQIQSGGVFTKEVLEDLKDRFGNGSYPFVIPAGTAVSQEVVGGAVKVVLAYKAIKGSTGTTLKVRVGNGLPLPKKGDTLSEGGKITDVKVDGNVATVTVTSGSMADKKVYSDTKDSLKPAGLLRSDIYVEDGVDTASCSIVWNGVVYEDRIMPVTEDHKKLLSNILFEKEV